MGVGTSAPRRKRALPCDRRHRGLCSTRDAVAIAGHYPRFQKVVQEYILPDKQCLELCLACPNF
eukprot:8203198-Heterocapsa_arctica.AAC.1